MTKNNPFLRFIEENNFAGYMAEAQKNTPNWHALFEMQRKNAQAWSQAGKITAQNLKNIAELNRKTLSQLSKEQQSLLRKMMSSSPSDVQMEENKEIIQSWIEKTTNNTKQVSKLLKSTQEQNSNILSGRLQESMDEFKSCLQNNEKSSDDDNSASSDAQNVA